MVAAEISFLVDFLFSCARVLHTLSCAHVCNKNIFLLQDADMLSECSEWPYFERKSILSVQAFDFLCTGS